MKVRHLGIAPQTNGPGDANKYTFGLRQYAKYRAQRSGLSQQRGREHMERKEAERYEANQTAARDGDWRGHNGDGIGDGRVSMAVLAGRTIVVRLHPMIEQGGLTARWAAVVPSPTGGLHDGTLGARLQDEGRPG